MKLMRAADSCLVTTGCATGGCGAQQGKEGGVGDDEQQRPSQTESANMCAHVQYQVG
jgi:hypothetical protein